MQEVHVPKSRKNKLKKMKDKYADQDEDEREMRLALLGAKQVKGVDLQKMYDKKAKFVEKTEE